MNTSKLIRQLANNARITYMNHQHVRRTLPKLSSYMSTSVSISQLGKDKEGFQDVLPCIIDSLLTNPKFSQLPEVAKWVQKVLDYNLIGGKNTRGMTTVYAYEMLEKTENITEEKLRLARILGWCVEMLQAYFIVVDDIMDGSTTRRGKPCWYRMPEVGLEAINDSILIYCAIYETLRSNFSETPIYVPLLELFNESLLFTSMGQHLDYMIAHRPKTDYSLFTIDLYNSIVKHKTSYYSFKLPVALGMLLAGNLNVNDAEAINGISFDLGRLFQIQDDYIDCFGDEVLTGKVGTDIQEGKCSWLAVRALERCNEAQKALFTECYSSKDTTHVARIKLLYEELNLHKLYRDEEEEIYQSIVNKTRTLPANIPPQLFLKMVEIVFKRKA